MTTTRRVMIIVATVAVGLSAYLALEFVSGARWFFAMVGQDCTRDLIDQKPSPDGRLNAQLSEVNRGATALVDAGADRECGLTGG